LPQIRNSHPEKCRGFLSWSAGTHSAVQRRLMGDGAEPQGKLGRLKATAADDYSANTGFCAGG
jgi:hypothetical protein